MFWWHYRSPYRTQDPDKPWPIVLWLQGGPVRLFMVLASNFDVKNCDFFFSFFVQ